MLTVVRCSVTSSGGAVTVVGADVRVDASLTRVAALFGPEVRAGLVRCGWAEVPLEMESARWLLRRLAQLEEEGPPEGSGRRSRA